MKKLLGIVDLGLLIGAALGLSPTMAVALLIPFTFYMMESIKLKQYIYN